MRLNTGMTPFERNFRLCLNDAILEAESILEDCGPTTTRIDGTGKRVKLQCGDRFAQGKNKRGVAIKPGNTATEDATGQMHSVPPCQRLKAGSNKKAIPVCPGEPTTEINGQIQKRKKPKNESHQRLTWNALVERAEILFGIA